MPVFNASVWLRRAAQDILDQTHTDLELLICDNASTDDTQSICSELAAEDNRVRYHRHPRNLGVFANHNYAFAASSSKYFKWASASDFCEPALLARCLEVLQANPDAVLAYPQSVMSASMQAPGVVYYQNLHLDDDRPSVRSRLFYDWIGFNNAFYGVFRRDALASVMPCKEAHGYDINMMAALALRGKFLEVSPPLLHRQEEVLAGVSRSLQQKRQYFGERHRDGLAQRLARQLDRLAIPLRSPIGITEKLLIEYDLLLRCGWIFVPVAQRIRRLVWR